MHSEALAAWKAWIDVACADRARDHSWWESGNDVGIGLRCPFKLAVVPMQLAQQCETDWPDLEDVFTCALSAARMCASACVGRGTPYGLHDDHIAVRGLTLEGDAHPEPRIKGVFVGHSARCEVWSMASVPVKLGDLRWFGFPVHTPIFECAPQLVWYEWEPVIVTAPGAESVTDQADAIAREVERLSGGEFRRVE